MSGVNNKPKFTTKQADLFQQLEQPTELAADADLNINLELLGAINTAIRQAKARGLSRDRIVDRMNHHLGGTEQEPILTLRQLNAWTAVSQEYKEFPARYLPAFCAATDCDLPLRVLAHAIKRDLVDNREAAALRLGESLVESARLAREQRDLKRTLGEQYT